MAWSVGKRLDRWMMCALRVLRLYSNLGDQKLRPVSRWCLERHGQRGKNELVIEPGRRQYRTRLIIQSQVQVETY
jgi:hypothetical protein